jgi:hypothetical protein
MPAFFKMKKESWRQRCLAEELVNELWQLDLEKQELLQKLREVDRRLLQLQRGLK